MIVIGLRGKARNGKDTVADIFAVAARRHGIVVRRIGFADAVKEEAKELGWNGVKDEAGRSMLQRVGSNGRARDSLYWIRRTFASIAGATNPRLIDSTIWVITDVRYQNEANAIKAVDMGLPSLGLLWSVQRVTEEYAPFDNGLTTEQKAHPSEVDMDGYQGYDAIILNRTLVETEMIVNYLSEVVLQRLPVYPRETIRNELHCFSGECETCAKYNSFICPAQCNREVQTK